MSAKQTAKQTAKTAEAGTKAQEPAKPTQDMVNRPSHYAPNGVDSFMHMKDQMGPDAFGGFLQGNALKYIQRHRFKGKPVEDLLKAVFYLVHLYYEAGGTTESLQKTIGHSLSHYCDGTTMSSFNPWYYIHLRSGKDGEARG